MCISGYSYEHFILKLYCVREVAINKYAFFPLYLLCTHLSLPSKQSFQISYSCRLEAWQAIFSGPIGRNAAGDDTPSEARDTAEKKEDCINQGTHLWKPEMHRSVKTEVSGEQEMLK